MFTFLKKTKNAKNIGNMSTTSELVHLSDINLAADLLTMRKKDSLTANDITELFDQVNVQPDTSTTFNTISSRDLSHPNFFEKKSSHSHEKHD